MMTPELQRRIRNSLYRLMPVVLVSCLLASGCNGTRAARVDHSSPRSVLASYVRSIHQRDRSAILECIDPAIRVEYKRMLASWETFDERARLLKEAIEQQLGREALGQFDPGWRPEIDFRCDPIYGGTEMGRVKWNKVRLERKQYGLVHVMVKGEGGGMIVKKIQGKWYVFYPRDAQGDLYTFRLSARIAKECADFYERTADGIRTGAIGRRDLSKMFLEGQGRRETGREPASKERDK